MSTLWISINRCYTRYEFAFFLGTITPLGTHLLRMTVLYKAFAKLLLVDIPCSKPESWLLIQTFSAQLLIRDHINKFIGDMPFYLLVHADDCAWMGTCAWMRCMRMCPIGPCMIWFLVGTFSGRPVGRLSPGCDVMVGFHYFVANAACQDRLYNMPWPGTSAYSDGDWVHVSKPREPHIDL